MKALSSENAGVRASAAEYLGRYQMKGSISALIEILKSDTSEPVRSAAAFALMLMNDEAGIKAVEESSLNDGSDKVATFCTKLLDLHTVRSYVAIFE
jgi:HEAT repeat protein